ncbi:MAG TPA: metallophosphoesterase family protein [Gemmatales bacterium]|nr:metallophosphoesterase family protein [Gemmatales bacterium]
MTSFSRRAFLGTSLAALAAGRLLADDKPSDLLPKHFDGPLFVPTSLFLTWQRDPTTTMTIQWIGAVGETSDTTIYYRPMVHVPAFSSIIGAPWNARKPVTKPYPMTELKVFRTELTGLTPGTDYQFRIGKLSPTYRFRTMPAKATDTIHFISGGDVSVNQHAVSNSIQAARQDPMFTVIGGDLGYDNGTSVEISLAFIRNYSKHMVGRDGRLIPLIPCIGNHEVDGQYHQPREKAPFFYALFDGLYPETGYNTLDFGDYLSLVLLDSGHTSEVGGAQADWLENTLKARIDHPHTLVVSHVPAYPAYSFAHPKFDNAKDGSGEPHRKHWVPLYQKYRVPVVLEHHDHSFKRTKPLIDGLSTKNGVIYLGDGSWGRLRGDAKPGAMSHLEATSEEYHLTLHRLQGEERFHLALNEHGKVMDVSRTGQRRKGLFSAGG